MSNKLKLNDNVFIVAGKDIGKKGKIMSINISSNRAVVGGVNMIKRHQAPRSESDPGGIIEKEAAINCSNLKVICPSCEQPTKVGFKRLADGKKVRFCKKVKCNEAID
ncbi:MAG: 50S ribosomal protein L24 [Dehalococcoidia bacterium]|nr:MAG: large subunit ribosomal protein L24 [Chloroflexota bacterium]